MPRASNAKPSKKRAVVVAARRPDPVMDRFSPIPPPIKEHDYTPPENASANDPQPENIVWSGEHVTCNVTIQDACLLYCVSGFRHASGSRQTSDPHVKLERADLVDLCDGNRVWLDIKTVAIRALREHGGLTAHNAL